MVIDWSQIYQDYRGQWVALKHDEVTVVGAGKTAKEALTEAHVHGYDDPILHRVPTEVLPYVGTSFS